MKIEWQKTDDGIGFIAAIGNVRLSVAPDRVVTQRGATKRAKNTKWGRFVGSSSGRGIHAAMVGIFTRICFRHTAKR